MEAKFKADHNGKGLLESLKADDNLSPATKAALDQLASGSDKRTTEESLAIAKIALTNKNLDLFQESMAMATPEARAKFMQDGGQKQIEDTWANHVHARGSRGVSVVQSTESQHALDYANYGQLSVPTQIHEANHTFSTDRKAIDLALNNMSDVERKLLAIGRQLAEHPNDPLPADVTPEQKKQAQDYYRDIQSQFRLAGNPTDIAKWQAEASVKGGGFIATFADHRGSFRNDSTDEIKQHVLNMSQKDWQDFKDHPERKDDLAKMLKSLGKSKDDVESIMGVLQAKMTAKGDTDGQHKLVDSISTMLKEDQEKYRTNEDFRRQTDADVKATLAKSPALDITQRMLERIKAGQIERWISPTRS